MYSLEINKKLKTYHLFLGVLITFLFAFLYAKLNDNPIDIETLERIKETSMSGPDNVKYREIQNLFMKERGWVFIIFGILTLTILLQIILSQIKKQSSRSFMGFRYRVSERMENLLNEKLSFQERLKKEFKDLT
ncbi:MAG: hypothetical protein R3213_10130, partial [Flavobacteriaceae bacterium]|nr:hypothetical protein [Flavobacteriaceae bacterium]